MGLFTQRPEFDDELPGLPGEPLRPATAAERLEISSPIDLGALGIDDLGATVESIVIPVVPVIEIAESQESGEGDPER